MKDFLFLSLRTFKRGEPQIARNILKIILNTKEATMLFDKANKIQGNKNKLLADIEEALEKDDLDAADEAIDKLSKDDKLEDLLEDGDTSVDDMAGGTAVDQTGYTPTASIKSILTLATRLDWVGHSDLSKKLRLAVK